MRVIVANTTFSRRIKVVSNSRCASQQTLGSVTPTLAALTGQTSDQRPAGLRQGCLIVSGNSDARKAEPQLRGRHLARGFKEAGAFFQGHCRERLVLQQLRPAHRGRLGRLPSSGSAIAFAIPLVGGWWPLGWHGPRTYHAPVASAAYAVRGASSSSFQAPPSGLGAHPWHGCPKSYDHLSWRCIRATGACSNSTAW